jgi:hypothetical protein
MTAAAFCTPVLSAASIPVVNHSFETPNFAACGFGSTDFGWFNGSAWNPGLGEECFWNGFPDGVTDGDQTGFVNSSAMEQVVAATLQPSTTYTLMVDVGRRSDGFDMKKYKIQLVAGETVIAEDNNELVPPLGGFETSVITADIGPSHPELGEPLKIKLWLIEGPQANFDNVQLFEGEVGPVGTPGDLDGDGDVDGSDLGTLLSGWGECQGSCAACEGDLNGDCQVDGGDLGILLANWG